MGIPFNEKELEIVSIQPETSRSPKFEKFSYPVTEREAYLNMLAGNPAWVLTGDEVQRFFPSIIPDNIARGFVAENGSFDPLKDAGGKDMFGVKWIYVPTAGGSMEDPNEDHLLEDTNDWREVIVFPDVGSWDWAGSAEKNKDYLADDKIVLPWIFTGWFERLVSFMGFENAAIALLDEDQRDALVELMDALSDVYIDIINHFVKYYGHVDGIFIHDDWGSQQAPFFSRAIAAEVFVPAMKKVTNHVHDLGMFAELHSCGNHGAQQIENIVTAGWDAWMPQTMNDIDALWQEWGDRILLSPQISSNLDKLSIEEALAAIDWFVERYCTAPGKPVYLHMSDKAFLVPELRKELYVKSREAYALWPE